LINFDRVYTDILVVGGGAAAALAAIRATEKGVRAILMTKSGFPSGASVMARSGFQAAMGHSDPADSPEVHYQDTMKAGSGLNSPALVRRMCEDIVRIVGDLDNWGVDLIKDGEKFSQRHRVGCTYPRHLHHYDTTGKAIMQTLKDHVVKRGIPVLAHNMVVDIFSDGGDVCGALALDYESGKFTVVEAPAVIIAAGGAGWLYAVTDNSPMMTGDGYALALRQGLPLIDMEMIDFQLQVCHPPEIKRYPPNSSAWIAAGACFYNGLGERFMRRHQPGTLEKSSRAMINRAVGIELHEGRGTKNGGVYLDLSAIPPEDLPQIGPSIYGTFARNGIDLSYQPMELAPGAHTFLGGVLIREDGSTEIGGLYAAGEVAGGVHGANRLGGNAVTDPLVFGDLAGSAAADYIAGCKPKAVPDTEAGDRIAAALEMTRRSSGVSPREAAQKVQAIMHENVGIVRSASRLSRAIQALDEIAAEVIPALSAGGNSARAAAMDLRRGLEVINMVAAGKAIAMSALARQESRGAHYRLDFPKPGGEEWSKHVGIRLAGGKYTIEYFTV